MSHQPNPPIRVLVVLGTRPEAVKLIPVVREIEREGSLEGVLVLTGQHRQLVEQMLAPLGIVAAHELKIARAKDSLTDLLVEATAKIDALYDRLSPDMVVVQGDTTSAFAAAVAAFYRRIPVAHVEAGLRSFDRFHPYPEEANRRMISAVADLHLAPTRTAARNLLLEGIDRKQIVVTGNTAVDSLLIALQSEVPTGDGSAALDITGPLVLITLHRRESWASSYASDQPIVQMLQGLACVAQQHPKTTFVYPVHPNPQVRGPAERYLGGLPNVRLLDPLPYLPFVRLMANATCVVTDSGGIQEEAPSLGVPVLVLRRTTERPEACQPGMNSIVGMDAHAIRAELHATLTRSVPRAHAIPCPNPYGDGCAAKRIVASIVHYFRLGTAPEEFVAGDVDSRRPSHQPPPPSVSAAH